MVINAENLQKKCYSLSAKRNDFCTMDI